MYLAVRQRYSGEAVRPALRLCKGYEAAKPTRWPNVAQTTTTLPLSFHSRQSLIIQELKMAVPKKRVSKTRASLRHTNWKKQLIPQALIALSTGKKQLIEPNRGEAENIALPNPISGSENKNE